jgi:lysyl-tRNA synthetase class I
MPAMVICENCGRTIMKNQEGEIVTNRVINFDKNKDSVSYICPACEYSGEVPLSSGLVKIGWRLDWPAKWSLEPKNVYEGSGKDHFTKITGSWDVAVDLCRNIYNYEGPVGLGFEWMRLGDSDMGTSKGVVFMPKTYLSMAEPELLRMIVLTTNPSRHISFRIEELSLLYDEFERLERIYYGIDEPFDVKKRIEEHKSRLEKDLKKDLEKEASKEFSEKIRNEKDVEKKKQLAKQKKSQIEKMVKNRFKTQFMEHLDKITEIENQEFSRQIQEVKFLYPLIRTKRIRKQCPPQIPHKFLVNMVQLQKYISFEEILRKAQETQYQKNIDTQISKSYLRKRMRQTRNWITHMKELIENTSDPDEKSRLESKVDLFIVPKTITKSIFNQLNGKQKESLHAFSLWLNNIEEITEDNLKHSMIKIRKDLGINAKELFQAIYLVLIGRSKGPRLGPFLSLMDLEWVKNRFLIFTEKSN